MERHTSSHGHADCQHVELYSGCMVNAKTLQIVDTLYLKILHQNVTHELQRSQNLLQQHFWQSEELAQAKELPSELSLHYQSVSDRLGTLVETIGHMVDDLESEFLCCKKALPTEEVLVQRVGHSETKSVKARLDFAESSILNVVNEVGERLADLPSSMMPWHDGAFFSMHVRLKSLPERPCYDLDEPITFRSVSFPVPGQNSPRNYCVERGQWPHYLILEIMPIDLVGMIDDFWMEMNVRAEGYASWMTQERDRFQD